LADNSITQGPAIRTPVNFNKTLQKPAYDGKVDQYGDVRIRLGIIDNPSIQSRSADTEVDPLNPKDVINMSTGKFTVKWLEQQGGLVRNSKDYSGTKKDDDNSDSDREPMGLTHPIMWASADNWMGFHYMPPVGSIILVGFRKHNLPVLLGFVQSHYEIVTSIELGEMMMKGFGGNTSHWKMHDEQEHTAYVTEGSSRPVKLIRGQQGRVYEWQKAPYTVGLRFRMKAWIDPKNPNDKKEMIEMYAYKMQKGIIQEHSMIELRPESVQLWSQNPISQKSKSEMTITPGGITSTTGTETIDASKVYIKSYDWDAVIGDLNKLKGDVPPMKIDVSGVKSEMASLSGSVTSTVNNVNSTVSSLNTSMSNLSSSLNASITALESRIAALESKVASTPAPADTTTPSTPTTPTTP
jgi:hypothetical protein